MFNLLPLKRVTGVLPEDANPGNWPLSVSSVRALLTDGLELSALTVITGENGAGKSVLIESIAEAYGFPLDGGSNKHQRESAEYQSPIGSYLTLEKGLTRGGAGLFYRSEALYQLVDYLASNGTETGWRMRYQSHGQSALDLIENSLDQGGLWIFDEPESGLSFSGQLRLISLIREHLDGGGQALLATHSPLLLSLPEAQLLEVNEHGITAVQPEELEVLAHWKSAINEPERYLRHL